MGTTRVAAVEAAEGCKETLYVNRLHR
jgi:hypothetical protein